jgi:hypothetical protein
VQDREEEPLMEYPDENDLPDSAIRAMWDEAEPVGIAAGPQRAVVEVAPSQWSQPPPGTTIAGVVKRRVVYFSFFGAATTRYPLNLADAGNNLTAVPSA